MVNTFLLSIGNNGHIKQTLKCIKCIVKVILNLSETWSKPWCCKLFPLAQHVTFRILNRNVVILFTVLFMLF